jgi:hypothetical protein
MTVPFQVAVAMGWPTRPLPAMFPPAENSPHSEGSGTTAPDASADS